MKITAIVVSLLFLLGLVAAAEDTAAPEPTTEKPQNFGQCVSVAAEAKNICYQSMKEKQTTCKTSITEKAALKACKTEYKTVKKQCKAGFKAAKTECQKIKHTFMESIRASFK